MQFAGIISNIHEKFFGISSGIPDPVKGRRVIVEINKQDQAERGREK